MKSKILKYLKYFGMIVLGNLLYSFAIEAIVKPYDIVTGGMTGISIYLAKLTPFTDPNLLWMNDWLDDVYLWVLTAVILVIGFIILGKELALQSLASAIVYPLCRAFFQVLNVASWEWFKFENPWIQILVAGLLIGVGLGLIIKVNASTGGMDTVGLVIHKYCKVFSVGAYLIMLDGLVMGIQLISVPFENFIFGIALAFIYSFAIDKVVMIGKNKVELLIISNKQEEVRNLITYEYDRTVTFLHSKTGYLNHEIDTILTIVDIRELNKIKDQIYALDPGAFIVVNKVSEVSGRGFTTNKKYKNNDIIN